MSLNRQFQRHLAERLIPAYTRPSIPRSCPSSQGQAARSPATPTPVAGEQVFEITLTDQVQAILLMAAAASGVTPAEVIARAIPFYASEAVGMPALLGDITRVPDGEGGR